MEKGYTAGGIVLNPFNEVLLVQHGTGNWSLPKGHIEPGEDKNQAAPREIREESGIHSLLFIKWYESYTRQSSSTDEIKEINIALFRTEQHELTISDEEQAVKVACWVGILAVADVLTHDLDKKFFRSVLTDIQDFLAEEAA